MEEEEALEEESESPPPNPILAQVQANPKNRDLELRMIKIIIKSNTYIVSSKSLNCI